MISFVKSKKRGQGFSLIEILVAMSVLALLGFIIAQMMASTSKTTRLSNQMVDTASQARLVFGCLGADISTLVKRSDVPFTARNASVGASDLLLFISGVPSADASLSTAANRGVSVVAYRVAVHADNANRPCLIRAGKAISWTMNSYFGLDSAGLPLSFSATIFPAALQPQTADFDILAPGVIRFVVGFQLYPDNQPVTLQDGTALPKAQGQVVYSPPVRTVTSYGATSTAQVVDLTRISALVIGIVVIDLNNLVLLNAAQITDLSAVFGVPSTDTLPVAAWGPTVGNPTLLPSTVPLPVRQSLRVFQRFYPITPFASRQ